MRSSGDSVTNVISPFLLVWCGLLVVWIVTGLQVAPGATLHLAPRP
jgi:hypothetical protein